MRALPWMLREAEVVEPRRQKIRGAGEAAGPESTAVPQILPMRQRPLTAGCAGCAHRGEPSHGFHHSIYCRKQKEDWLARQLGPPCVEPVPEVSAGDGVPQSAVGRRLVGKQTPLRPLVSAPSSSSVPTSVPPSGAAASSSTTAVKRPADTDPEELEAAAQEEPDSTMMELLEVLNQEFECLQCEDAVDGVWLDDGAWGPRDLVVDGDAKEIQGLLDRGVIRL